MPGTNQFLPFAAGAGANTLTPTAYAALTSLLSSGFASGVANSAQFNTALRQATTAAAGLAQFIANQGPNVNDDGNSGAFAALLATAVSGRLLAVRVFTTANSGQTYTPTAGTTSVIIHAVGGGGAAGGTPATGAGQTALSNGGSPGSYGASRYTTGFNGVLLTIGAGGTSVTGGNGGNGGTTSFGTLLSCPGGGGSGAGVAVSSAQNFSAFAQPLPSQPSGANLFTHLGFAKPGVLCLNGWGYFAGSGGDTLLGSGGQGFGGSFAAQNGSGYGSGGGGVANDASQAAKAGGNGAPGVIIVWEYA